MSFLAAPPTPTIHAKARSAVEQAEVAGAGTQRERDYIAAIETFYRGSETVDRHTRARAYARAMEQLARRYPDDHEAAVFHALAVSATALPTDKTYAQQLEAAAILEALFAGHPDHPGVAHYLIHAYDYPPLAWRGLAAARRYALIAPSSAHALHMPSHIFTRQGLWQECVQSNRASMAAATHDADRLHAMDYLVYAHLQQAQDREAKRILDQASAVERLDADAFVAAYALAAIPSRYVVERGRWEDAPTRSSR